MKLTLPLLLIVACGGEIGIRDRDGGDLDEDLSRYDDATLQIVQPRSASFLELGASHGFRAELRDAQGEPLDGAEIAWSSSADAAWSGSALSFESADLDIGLHDLTATARLPNGDRLAFTVGAVLVQAEVAGTYVGTITSGFELQGFPVSCGGASTLVVEPRGEQVTGRATCLAAAGGFELPLEFTVDALHEGGAVEGQVSARIIAFDLDFPASGGLADGALQLSFQGNVFGSDFDGRIRTTRISRDTAL